ncbi:MAG: AAA family ATPase [Desulfobacteraceae bacterium]|nr:AAA family ATPase [Desulfobacteraceae bacterium]
MEYYTLLQLKGEPFSNSPDPDYFFQSRQHQTCLQKLELGVRLKRGLNVVIGDVGTGKTTMCRELIRKFAQDPAIETHLLLDPAFPSAEEFLSLLYAMLSGRKPAQGRAELQIKEQIKQTLFQKGVDQNKIIMLIIDEGQKISSPCLEVLREMLNFETNHFKLLQIVIFAQPEFNAILAKHANFADRINLLHHLGPMSFSDTRRMIYHRLKLASRTPKPKDLFTLPALWAIYRSTHGYPRKIVHLCHQSMLTMIIQNQSKAGWSLIRSCRKRMVAPQTTQHGAWLAISIGIIVLGIIAVLWLKQSYITGSDHLPVPVLNVPPKEADPRVSGQEISNSQIYKEEPPPIPNISEPPTELPKIETAIVPMVEPAVTTVPKLAQISAQPPQPEPQPQAAVAITEQAASPAATTIPPAMIGELAVRPGDTFLGLIRLVYGSNSNLYLRTVIEANPHIVNPNAIDLNDVIYFPAIVASLNQTARKEIRVLLDQPPTLAAARSRLESLHQKYPMAMRLDAYWTPGDGLRFAITSSKHFPDPQAAQQWMDKLPEELRPKSSIQNGWPENAVIFSMQTSQSE